MIKFSKDKVLLLHQLMAEATGGSIGVWCKTNLKQKELWIRELKSIYLST